MIASISNILRFVNKKDYFKNAFSLICVPELVICFINISYKPLFNTFKSMQHTPKS